MAFRLEFDDVSLRHGKLYFRPNQWRRMKTRGPERSMPLWPQLEEILRTYLLERERDGGIEGPLLFPSTRRGGGRMLNDIRKALDTIAKRAGFETTMIDARYGHLHDRAVAGGMEVVEFRVEHHREKLPERLKSLEETVAAEAAEG